jgi:serine/threonine protein kinase
MKAEASCPPSQTLQRLITGELDEESAWEVLTHIKRCPDCENTICTLEQQDTLADQLHRAVKQDVHESDAYLEEPQFRRLASSLQGMHWKLLAEDELIGSSLNEYEIVDLLGRGGMGTVYRAIHKRLKREVALKVLPKQFQQSEAVARFEREMLALGRLSHPNIVRASDAGEQNGLHYLVMELVDGKDLSQIVKETGQLRIADAVLLTMQAAKGLEYAHQKGVIHRDIKPSNLMLSAGTDRERPQIKILDLGLAKALDAAADQHVSITELSISGQIMGTADYMAPEQINETSCVDHRTDIYALGATLFKLLTGKTPFAAQANLPTINRLAFIANNEPPPIREIRPEIPKELAKTVHRMIARLPEDRFATVHDVIAALQPFSVGADLPALLQNSTPRPQEVQLRPSLREIDTRVRPPRNLNAMHFGGLAIILLSIILTFATRYGTVTVTSSSGEIPADLQISISKGGDEIAVLQSDNQWSVVLANGEYELRTTGGGEDRFHLRERRLTIHRLHNHVLTIDIATQRQGDIASSQKANTESNSPLTPNQQSFSRKSNPSNPTIASQQSSKPFWLIRKGEDFRNFSTLAGTLEDLQLGDVIEIRTDERIQARSTEPITKPLDLRAGDGYRPMVDFPDHMGFQILADLTIEGCDIDIRNHPFPNITTQASWEFRNCRIWGDLKFPGTNAKLVNSIIVCRGIEFSNQNAHVQSIIDNCLIRHSGPFLTLACPTLQITLNDCSFHSIGHGCAGLFQDERNPSIPPTTNVSIHASGNLFNYHVQYPELIPATLQPQVTWTGRDNLFVGNWQQQWEEFDGEWNLTDQGLSLWNKWLPEPELGALELPKVAMEWGRIQRLQASDAFEKLEQLTQRIRQQTELPELGPDWRLIGPGDAHVRALTSNAKVTPAEQLRPERLVEGNITLLRHNTEMKGFVDINEAINAAMDGDIIELRTDGLLPSVTLTGEGRLLTIRAAMGYSPQIASLQNIGSDRLIVEGLIIHDHLLASADFANYSRLANGEMLFAGNGTVVRIANCQFQNGDFSGNFTSTNGTAAEIINCHFARGVHIGLQPGQTLNIRNCLFRDLTANVNKIGSGHGRITIDHCTFFRPESVDNLDHRHGILCHTALEFEMTHSLIAAGSPQTFVPLDSNAEPRWKGDHNVFIGSYSTSGYKFLETLQNIFNCDSHSIELNPWEFDPAQWRILQEATPGYKPRADGTDFGARINDLITLLK